MSTSPAALRAANAIRKATPAILTAEQLASIIDAEFAAIKRGQDASLANLKCAELIKVLAFTVKQCTACDDGKLASGHDCSRCGKARTVLSKYA